MSAYCCTCLKGQFVSLVIAAEHTSYLRPTCSASLWTHTLSHVYVYTYIMCIYIHTCIYIYIYLYVYMHTYVHMYIHIYSYLHMYIYIYVYINILMYVYLHIYIYTYVYTFIYIHMYICSRPLVHPGPRTAIDIFVIIQVTFCIHKFLYIFKALFLCICLGLFP